ncbi:hypothetical protein HanHA300_Chr17g0655811 [Helianthus annuus]|nr:hypothetical protein HanHA300_Chr17g0655811 [Helianthus annuus]
MLSLEPKCLPLLQTLTLCCCIWRQSLSCWLFSPRKSTWIWVFLACQKRYLPHYPFTSLLAFPLFHCVMDRGC